MGCRPKSGFDPEYLHSILRYDPETGKLYWRHREDRDSRWNNRYAGKEAFTNAHRSGRRVTTLNGRQVKAHHVVWALCKGKWPSHEVDHEDGDAGNNREVNLRDGSGGINQRNLKLNRNNRTGYPGLTRLGKKKWRARGNIDGRKVHLGTFPTRKEAIEARKSFELEHGYTGRL